MRPSERLNLISNISSELQSRYTYQEIDSYLSPFGAIVPNSYQGPNSKRLYSAEILKSLEDELLSEIAEDLELSVSSASLPLPRIWQNMDRLRLFISHISQDKEKAIRMRDCLFSHEISAFVAHEDIQPTLVWQTEIERALAHMHAFLSIHTPGFSNSNWTQQEIGFAASRRVKIIALQLGETPTGFIGKEQALPRRNRKAEEISEEVAGILRADPKTAAYLPSSGEDPSDGIPF